MRYKYDYGMLVNGKLEYAPVPLVIDGVEVYTNHRLDYIGQGYCDLVKTEQPFQDGFYFTEGWEQTDGFTITQTWTAHKIEESEDEGMDRSLDIEARINDLEIAICELAEALME